MGWILFSIWTIAFIIVHAYVARVILSEIKRNPRVADQRMDPLANSTFGRLESFVDAALPWLVEWRSQAWPYHTSTTKPVSTRGAANSGRQTKSRNPRNLDYWAE